MAKKNKTNNVATPAELMNELTTPVVEATFADKIKEIVNSGMSQEDMAKRLVQLEAELAATKAKAARPRKLTPEQEAAKAVRDAWEAVELAEPGTGMRAIQDLDRLTQVDAFPKVIRMMKWDRVAGNLFDLIQQVMEDTDRTFDDIFTEATTRKHVNKAESPMTEAAKDATATLLAAMG